jgi:putative ATPase
MELFEKARSQEHEPLASRMRPRTIDEYAGQDHIIGPGRLLRRAIQLDQLSSLILYGPPGTGKTTLARVIANTTKRHFITINAVLSGVKEIREAIDKAKELVALYDEKTILFVDEVHRWNKAQQDALLPWVENGTFILIGATIENPFFEVNRALVSRSRIFQLVPLTDPDLAKIVEQALHDKERGYGKYDVSIDGDAMSHLVSVAGGDARCLLNAIELAVETTPSRFPPEPGTCIRITLDIAEQSIQKKAVLYDREGDYHFDTISAFIKSLRGSDPDAALYWLAKMVHAGEDPRFIFRRMLILACEDVGMADPQAIVVVSSLASAFERIGLPEGRFHLAHAALYLSTCPKSNSALGFFDALSSVETEKDSQVPGHLRDSSRDKDAFGHGEGYLYPHSYRDHWVPQAYLPASLSGRVFYKPSSSGYEARIQSDVTRRREAQLSAGFDKNDNELLTFSPDNDRFDEWYSRTMRAQSDTSSDIRDKIFGVLDLKRYSRVFDAGAKSGLLLWEALRRVPEGSVFGLVESDDERILIEHYSSTLAEAARPVLIRGTLRDFIRSDHPEIPADLKFDGVIGRNIFTRDFEKRNGFEKLFMLLGDNGRLSISEVIPSKSSRLLELAGIGSIKPGIDSQRLFEAEEAIYSSKTNPLMNWDETSLADACKTVGFEKVESSIVTYTETRVIRAGDLAGWMSLDADSGLTYGKQLKEKVSEQEYAHVVRIFEDRLVGKHVDWITTVVFISAVKSQ